MLTKYEKNALREIERWQAKKIRTGITPAVINLLFFPVEELTNYIIPEKLIEKAVKPMTRVIMDLRDLSGKFASPDAVLEKARKCGLDLEKQEELKSVPLEYLDALSKSFFEKSALYATVQGIGLGAGGYATVLVDIPMIFTQSLKMIFQIGASYGYDPDAAQEKEFALRIFSVVTSHGSVQDTEIREVEKLIEDFSRNTFRENTAILASQESAKVFVYRVARWMLKKRSLRGVMFVGMAMGSTMNYFFIKESSIYAYMFYRKRFLREKLSRRA